MSMTLADRIEKRIREIPASNHAYVSFIPETIGTILSHSLLRRIAEEAAEVAETHTQPSALHSHR